MGTYVRIDCLERSPLLMNPNFTSTTTIDITGISGTLDVLKSLVLSGYTVTVYRRAPEGVILGSELTDQYRIVAQK